MGAALHQAQQTIDAKDQQLKAVSQERDQVKGELRLLARRAKEMEEELSLARSCMTGLIESVRLAKGAGSAMYSNLVLWEMGMRKALKEASEMVPLVAPFQAAICDVGSSSHFNQIKYCRDKIYDMAKVIAWTGILVRGVVWDIPVPGGEEYGTFGEFGDGV